MCGIVGYYALKKYKDEIKSKLDLIHSRGPDSSGEVQFHEENVNIGLGHVRLSILDLSKNGFQPFQSKCGNFTMIYNGEVYNFKELRSKLPGIEFSSSSDTEVIIELFAKYGEAMLNWLKGMFAIAILNNKSKELFIARDQLGIKPLYFQNDGEKFIFASELKAIFKFKDSTKKVDPSCLTEFFLNGFLYEPDTGFKNTYKVKPGEFLKISLSTGRISSKKTQYWTPLNPVNIKEYPSLKNIVKKSVVDHTISDVPVGLFYSGGIDSTLILTELNNKIDPFIVARSKESYKDSGFADDSYYADEIARELKIKLNKIKLDEELNKEDNFFSQIEDLVRGVEEPIADFTFTSTEVLSKKVKELGYTVMLSGMGADEVFGGYPRYNLVKFAKSFKYLAPIIKNTIGRKKSFEKKIERFNSFFEEKSFEIKYTSLIGSFSTKDVEKMVQSNKNNLDVYILKLRSILNEAKDLSKMKKAMYLDWLGFLSHNFIVADKSSMRHSVEIRVPLATKEMYEKVFSGKDKLMSFFKSKIVLRKMLYKVLPKKLIDRKKTGFNPPMDDIIRKIGEKNCIDYIQKSGLLKYCDKEFIINLLSVHFKGEKNKTFKVFQILFISAWLKINSE